MMTKTTNSRQLRMLLDGVLSSYGIDNLQLSIDLCESVKKFLASDDNPVKARENILKGLSDSLAKGASTQVRLDEIEAEIKNRVRLNPTGREWEDFLRWAYRQEKEKGEKIETFIDWWTADEWRMAHPPSSPQSWYVKWPQAFPIESEKVEQKEGGSGYYA